MISKLDSFICRSRWKAFFFDHKNTETETETTNNYGFKTEICPTQHKDLVRFENNLYELVRNIQFKGHSATSFQNQLKADANKINRSSTLLIPADKTTNYVQNGSGRLSQTLT